MPAPALHPDVLKAKFDMLKRWRDTEAGRKESLGGWKATQLDDGTLMLSGRVRGPKPAQALTRFVDRQAMYLANRLDGTTTTDRLPALDVSDPDRTAAVWRTGDVWVELWHPADTVTPEPIPATPSPSGPVSRRSSARPGGRLPFTRRKRKAPAA